MGVFNSQHPRDELTSIQFGDNLCNEYLRLFWWFRLDHWKIKLLVSSTFYFIHRLFKHFIDTLPCMMGTISANCRNCGWNRKSVQMTASGSFLAGFGLWSAIVCNEWHCIKLLQSFPWLWYVDITTRYCMPGCFKAVAGRCQSQSGFRHLDLSPWTSAPVGDSCNFEIDLLRIAGVLSC